MRWRRLLHRFCVVVCGVWAVALLLLASIVRNDPNAPVHWEALVLVATLPLAAYFAIFWVLSAAFSSEPTRGAGEYEKGLSEGINYAANVLDAAIGDGSPADGPTEPLAHEYLEQVRTRVFALVRVANTSQTKGILLATFDAVKKVAAEKDDLRVGIAKLANVLRSYPCGRVPGSASDTCDDAQCERCSLLSWADGLPYDVVD